MLDTHPDTDEYLKDHVLEDTPVMPAVVAMELMAEAAAAQGDGLVVTSVSDLRVLQGITYPGLGGRTLRVEVTGAPPAGQQAPPARVGVSITSGSDRPIVHYRAAVTLARALETPPSVKPLRVAGSRLLPMSVDDLYRQWLFHGPRFAGIVDVTELGENGIVGRLRASSPERLLGDHASGVWLTDPLVLDSGLQLLIVWARAQLDQTPLPSRLRCYHRYTEAFRSRWCARPRSIGAGELDPDLPAAILRRGSLAARWLRTWKSPQPRVELIADRVAARQVCDGCRNHRHGVHVSRRVQPRSSGTTS